MLMVYGLGAYNAAVTHGALLGELLSSGETIFTSIVWQQK